MDEYKLAQIEAANDILAQSDLYFYRKVCRWYSTTFHTPLTQVNSIPWDEILQHYYEHHYENLKYNDLLQLTKDLLPEIAEKQEEEMDDFLNNLMEAERAKKTPKKQSLNKTPPDLKSNSKESPTKQPPEIYKTFDVGEDIDL